MNAIAIQDITDHYLALTRQIPLRPIHSKADYKRAIAAMEQLLDAGAADESHVLADLVATLGELIADYEDCHHAPAQATGAELLRFMMQQHGLKQTELPEIGSQGVVSEVLNGKRELNIRQAKALAQRFGLSPAAFI